MANLLTDHSLSSQPEPVNVLSWELRDRARRIRAHLRAARKNFLATGRDLNQAKRRCKHGEWLPFVRACGFPHERTAQRLMQYAREVDAGKASTALTMTAVLEATKCDRLSHLDPARMEDTLPWFRAWCGVGGPRWRDCPEHFRHWFQETKGIRLLTDDDYQRRSQRAFERMRHHAGPPVDDETAVASPEHTDAVLGLVWLRTARLVPAWSAPCHRRRMVGGFWPT